MPQIEPVLALRAPWTVILIAVLLVVALIQVLRLEPPWRRRGNVTDASDSKSLIGRTGRVLTPMRPVGMCEFDGRRIECVAENGYVQKDRAVRVVRVEGDKVTVQVLEEA